MERPTNGILGEIKTSECLISDNMAPNIAFKMAAKMPAEV